MCDKKKIAAPFLSAIYFVGTSNKRILRWEMNMI
jgi:hypothetical protein